MEKYIKPAMEVLNVEIEQSILNPSTISIANDTYKEGDLEDL